MEEIVYKFIAAKYQRPRKIDSKIQSIILHSTDGREIGDVETFTTGGGKGVSIHWYVTREGKVYHFVQDLDCAYHAGLVLSQSNNNDSSIGIEQEHFDDEDEDWPDVQVREVAKLVVYLRSKFGEIPVFSHAAIAKPHGRKQDPKNYPWDKLRDYVKEISKVGVKVLPQS